MQISEKEMRDALKEYFGERPLIFIKFTQKKEWAQDVLDGKLYMNKAGFYKELEEKSGKKGQGDVGELQPKLTNVECTVILNPTDKEKLIEIPFESKMVKLRYEEDMNYPLYCLTGLTIDEFIISEYSEKKVTLELPYSKMRIEEIENDFGRYAVVIPPSEFEERLYDSLSKEKVAWKFGKVKYRNNNNQDWLNDFINQSEERFLYKDLDFSYQNEFRLVLDTEIENSMVFEIDSLNGIGHI